MNEHRTGASNGAIIGALHAPSSHAAQQAAVLHAMHSEERLQLRVTCLRMAIETRGPGSSRDEVLACAKAFESYLTETDPPKEAT